MSGEMFCVCADHRIGIRTEENPAFFIVRKYSFLIKTPHSPSLDASNALAKFIPLPIFLFCKMVVSTIYFYLLKRELSYYYFPFLAGAI